jgi:uncharacterized membrane protein
MAGFFLCTSGPFPVKMLRLTKNAPRIGEPRSVGWVHGHAGQFCVLVCLAAFAVAAGAGWLRGHAQSPPGPAAATSPKAAGAQAPAPARQNKQSAVSAADDASKQLVASECADLLKMATALKIEVDKSTKDTLSVTLVRKADEIEQFAHKVRLENGEVEANHAKR